MRYTIYLKAEDNIQRIVVVADEDATPEKAEFSAELVRLGRSPRHHARIRQAQVNCLMLDWRRSGAGDGRSSVCPPAWPRTPASYAVRRGCTDPSHAGREEGRDPCQRVRAAAPLTCLRITGLCYV
jgi:hypothetical protein